MAEIYEQAAGDIPELRSGFNDDFTRFQVILKPKTSRAAAKIDEIVDEYDAKRVWDLGVDQPVSVEVPQGRLFDFVEELQSTRAAGTLEAFPGFGYQPGRTTLPVDYESLTEQSQRIIAAINDQNEAGLVRLPPLWLTRPTWQLFEIMHPQAAGPADTGELEPLVFNLEPLVFNIDGAMIETLTPTVWEGQSGLSALLKDGDGIVHIGTYEDRYVGSIVTNEKRYLITPFEDENVSNLYLVVETGGGDGEVSDHDSDEAPPPVDNYTGDPLEDRIRDEEFRPERIDLYFVFSPEAARLLSKTYRTDLEDFAFSELNTVNQFDPRLGVEFVVAGADEQDFQQDQNFANTSDAFVYSSNTLPTEVRRRRNQLSADIVVIAVYMPGEPSCGRVHAIGAKPDHAYLVWNLRPECLKRESLAHEIAHVFGGVHDDHNDSSRPPASGYGFGFAVGDRGCQTVLAQTCRKTLKNGSSVLCPRSGWADPRRTFRRPPECADQAMGTYERNDMARLIKERAPLVANFR